MVFVCFWLFLPSATQASGPSPPKFPFFSSCRLLKVPPAVDAPHGIPRMQGATTPPGPPRKTSSTSSPAPTSCVPAVNPRVPIPDRSAGAPPPLEFTTRMQLGRGRGGMTGPIAREGPGHLEPRRIPLLSLYPLGPPRHPLRPLRPRLRGIIGLFTEFTTHVYVQGLPAVGDRFLKWCCERAPVCLGAHHGLMVTPQKRRAEGYPPPPRPPAKEEDRLRGAWPAGFQPHRHRRPARGPGSSTRSGARGGSSTSRAPTPRGTSLKTGVCDTPHDPKRERRRWGQTIA